MTQLVRPSSSTHVRTLRLLALLLAFSAGFTALAVQIVCVRLAIQRFGSSASTVGSMIAMSLAGLSIGALIIGHKADRSMRPTMAVGFAFFVCSFLMVFIAAGQEFIGHEIEAMTRFNSSTAPGYSNPGMQQIVFAAITMLPINFLLGGTLPLLVRLRTASVTTTSHTLPMTLGLLYAFETLGAATGSIAVGFWSIQSIGLHNTLIVASVLIGSIGVLAIVAGIKPLALESSPVSHHEQPSDQAGLLSVLFLFVVALTGSATLGMEVIWQRFFVVLFGSDTHSYSIVAASYLLGISLGAALSPFIVRLSTDWLRAYAWTIIAVGAASTAVTSVVLYLLGEDAYLWSSQILMQRPVLARVIISISLMMLPTTMIGIAFPVAACVWTRDIARAPSRTGQVYAAALLGNVLGILATGFWLIPATGLRTSMLILAGGCVVSGVVLVLFSLATRRAVPRYSFSKLLLWTLPVIVLLGWGLTSFWLQGQASPIGVATIHDKWQVDFYEEGAVNTVAVVSNRQNPEVRRMIIDGITIGESDGGVDEKQQLLAHLPFLLRPDKANQIVLTIGLGTGILAGELAENPQVDVVWCVELSAPVVAAAEHFSDLNGDFLNNEKARLVRSDGIHFLRTTEIEYDAIISDAKSRPGHAGNVAFFSRDYYQLCNSRLSEHGIFVQWVSLATSNDAVGLIIQTFADVFPYGHIGVAAPDSIFIVGSKQPLQLSRNQLEAWLTRDIAGSLSKYSWKTFDDFVTFYWIDQETARAFMNDGKPYNTFDRPVLETYALAALRSNEFETKRANLEYIRELMDFEIGNNVDDSLFNAEKLAMIRDSELRNQLKNGRLSARAMVSASIQMLALDHNWLDSASDYYKQALKLTPELTRQSQLAGIFRQLAVQARDEGKLEQEFSALTNISELKSGDAADEYRLAEMLFQLDRYDVALDHFYRAASLAPANSNYRAKFGFCLLKLNKNSQAVAQFQKVVNMDSENPLANSGLGIALLRQGRIEQAQKLLRKAVDSDPSIRELIADFGIEAGSL